MTTCLDYLNIAELNALVQARNRAEQCRSTPSSIDDLKCRRSTDNRRGGVPSDTTPLPYSLSQPERQIRAEKTPTIAMLKKSSDLAPNINITRWKATDQFVADKISLNESVRNSPTNLSVTGQSQVLEDYPALLSYATFKLFIHAQLAEEKGADPGPLISRLKEKNTWARWITLREDVPQGIELLDYITDQGLSTWVSNIRGNSNATGRSPGGKLKISSSDSGVDYYDSRYRALSRRSGVASFGSVGSYCSSIDTYSLKMRSAFTGRLQQAGLRRKTTSFNNEVSTRTYQEAQSGSSDEAIESDSEMDSSDGEWEDYDNDNENSGHSSVNEKDGHVPQSRLVAEHHFLSASPHQPDARRGSRTGSAECNLPIYTSNPPVFYRQLPSGRQCYDDGTAAGPPLENLHHDYLECPPSCIVPKNSAQEHASD